MTNQPIAYLLIESKTHLHDLLQKDLSEFGAMFKEEIQKEKDEDEKEILRKLDSLVDDIQDSIGRIYEQQVIDVKDRYPCENSSDIYGEYGMAFPGWNSTRSD